MKPLFEAFNKIRNQEEQMLPIMLNGRSPSKEIVLEENEVPRIFNVFCDSTSLISV